MASDLRRKEELPLLTDRIVETYVEVGSINHLGHCPLPNYDAVIECIPTCAIEKAPKYARTTSIEHLEMKINQMNDTPKFKESEAA